MPFLKGTVDVVITMLLTVAVTMVIITAVAYIFNKNGITLTISIGSVERTDFAEIPAKSTAKAH